MGVRTSRVIRVRLYKTRGVSGLWCLLKCGHTRTIAMRDSKPVYLRCPKCMLNESSKKAGEP